MNHKSSRPANRGYIFLFQSLQFDERLLQ